MFCCVKVDIKKRMSEIENFSCWDFGNASEILSAVVQMYAACQFANCNSCKCIFIDIILASCIVARLQGLKYK